MDPYMDPMGIDWFTGKITGKPDDLYGKSMVSG